ncbi:MAG: Gfo/Idh/MocA family oxidoreductase [Acidimicrobiales bacterium]|nr:Gfo/Idh/MocA family oxidoreductase [Acidimicrobiales bacterium]
MTHLPDGHRSIVIGAGSIGLRHRRVLESLGSEVVTVSQRPGVGEYRTIIDAFSSIPPDYVVVATRTEGHFESIEALVETGYSGQVLLEKPIFDYPRTMPDLPFTSVSIGYQLRFHPAVRRLKAALARERVLSAQIRYGQYLPDWRPSRDYRKTVTAGPAGGVLLELSHELDLVQWLLGPAKVLHGHTLRSGTLEMEREDLAVGLLALDLGGVVSLELNCLDRVQNRTMTVTSEEHFFYLDLVAGSLSCDGKTISPGPIERDDVFAAMHQAVVCGEPDPCTVDDAIAVLRMVEDLRSA